MRGTSKHSFKDLSACTYSYVKGLLGAPTPAEYEAVQAEKASLQRQLEEANKKIEELTAKVGNRCASSYCKCKMSLADFLWLV